MERVHRPRHIAAALLLAAVAAGYGYLAVYDERVAGEQIRAATVALKEADPALYAHDPEFGPRGVWRGHSPLFQAMLKLVLVPAGYEDSTLPFRAMAPVMALVFLLGMYALIYRQCRNWSVSVFVAGLSSTVTNALGGYGWGFGPVATATSGGLCLALSPLVVLGFLSCADPGARGGRRGRSGDWKLLLVFACVGLLGNVDLSASINMTLVLVGAYLLHRRMSLRAWPIAVGCVFAAAAAAIPQGVYLLALRQSIAVRPAQGAAAADVVEALRQADLRVLFPILAREFLDELLACGVVILLAGAVLIRIGRFRARNLGFWAAMLASALLVSLGLQGLLQLVGALLGRPPAAIDFVRAAPLAMLPLYVMAAQTITNLFRLSRRGKMVRWGCVGLLAVWMIPSDNLRVPRHGVYGLMTAHVPEANIPARFRRRVRKRAERRARRAELARIAHWARSNTSADAVFFTGEPEFRMLSRRSILAGEDVRWTFYLAPGRLAEWMARAERLRLLVEPPTGRADAEALHKFIIDLAGEQGTQWKGVDEWYAILDADAAPEESAWLKYIPAAENGWGRYLVVARVQ